MTNTIRIHELVAKLTAANRAYYQENREIMTDLEYDTLYDELVELEKSSGIQLAGSPTRKVGYEIVSGLAKVPHTTPMLSLDKTKSPETLETFLDDQVGLLSWKLDGLTIILKYENGELKQALTRGNGNVGEDVTHNARFFSNVPLTVPYKGIFDLRGEAVITLSDFEAINENAEYKNPRNLCSGAVRQLNNEITASRRVLFYAFGTRSTSDNTKSAQLEWLSSQGFDIVPYEMVTGQNVTEAIARFKEKIPTAPWATDGLVLTYNDIAYSESLGATSKFPRDSIAFKWADELAETTLLTIEWNTSRTGRINPVAIFEPVDIEGSQVSQASVHNVSILRELELCPNDRITVYKANMIIPQVAENLSQKDNTPREVMIPTACQACGGATEIIGDPEVLYCTNPACDAQQIRALSHFVSRDALNIAGLSEQTLEKFVTQGIVTNYMSLFDLQTHEDTILQMEGFGQKSYEKLTTAIETAKDIPLPNFIYALGIRHVGLSNAKLLCKYVKYDAMKILEMCKDENYQELLVEIKGYGDAIANSLHQYFIVEKNEALYKHALSILRIQFPEENPAEQPLVDLSFVITGDVTQFKNRKTLSDFIETHGGRTTGTVTAKTSYLINNDITSTTGKNKKATQLGVPVITEDDFLKLIAIRQSEVQ
ncbi:MAG: NAD-dependent DNA ligase LigA [Defluviitaleaceae bacterium]|nr:NAD-dependent DNA ligase LigA [Defluviitaleaceae bacterium]